MKRFLVFAALAVACGSSSSDGGGPGTTGPGGPDAGGPVGTGVPTDLALQVSADFRVVQTKQSLLHVNLVRSGGAAPVTITAKNLPPGVTAQPLTIPANTAQGDVVFEADPGASSQGQSQKITLDATTDPIVKSVDVNVVVAGPPGTLDLSFGSQGTMTAPFDAATYSSVSIVGILPNNDTQLVFANLKDTSNKSFVGVARLKEDGKVDTTFGNNGVVAFATDTYYVFTALRLADNSILCPGVNNLVTPFHLHISADGTTADATWTSSAGPGTRFFQLDASQNWNAITYRVGGTAGNERLFWAGEAGPKGVTTVNNYIARVSADYTALDSAFNGGAPILTPAGGTGYNPRVYTNDLVVRADGTFITATSTNNDSGSPGSLKLMAYTADGAPLTSFGNSGAVFVAAPGKPRPDASLFSFQDGSIGIAYSIPDISFSVRRFDANGAALAPYAVPGSLTANRPVGTLRLPDQSVLVVSTGGGDDQYVTTRFKPDGALDAEYAADVHDYLHIPGTNPFHDIRISTDQHGRYLLGHNQTILRLWN